MRIKSKLESWLNYERPPARFPICDFGKLSYGVRPGDVVLVEGRSRVANVIRVITQSRWSHSALYVGRIHDIRDESRRNQLLEHFNATPDQQLLIEGILGKGMIVTPLTDYAKDNLRICRPSSLSASDAQAVINYTIDRLGVGYDVRQLFDLARFIFPWRILPRKWRSSLFTRNPDILTKTVCSSLIAEAFYSVQYPILPLFRRIGKDGVELIPRNTRLYTPADFDYSPYFDIKKYPFFGTSGVSPYRNLPWNKDGVVGHGEQDFDVYHKSFSRKSKI
ncbi:YiiX/YebB-like N1pC/P60 family cysteine hydrolase [Aliikangiella sp. G2MR2-5]|uniref:YiiX/YebB-like N1pC/P60 family cysteine hydrolase n=1 Tax=Aliikangiella sp. G2MR2-5 TaxID=2788943 RepID=UPI0018AB3C6E|nr:YiiX/YebB-like N1pC/P60 family cysteine hydrolase [Aliikangiella sp. G2MR2-5]